MLILQVVMHAHPARATSDRSSGDGNTLSTTTSTQQTGSNLCSTKFHSKLGTLAHPLAAATQTAADVMRNPSSTLPGQWLFWDGFGIAARTARQKLLLATPIINERDNMMCERSVLVRGGRIRCLKWQPIPPGYKPPEPAQAATSSTQPKISRAERRMARNLSALVVRKGAFRELEHDTPLFHIAQRATDELVAYTAQDHRNTLCTGVGAMLSFYRRTLKPIYLQAVVSRELLAETRSAAISATFAFLGKDTQFGKDTAPDLNAVLPGILKSMLTEEEISIISNAGSAIKSLEEARNILTDQRMETIPATRKNALLKTLRNLEFMIYATHASARWSALRDSFEVTLQAIATSHRNACDC